jgi:type I restriction enzyme M protein
MERRIFPAGKDKKRRSFEDYRWSRLKHLTPAEMFTVVGEHVFPFLRTDFARQLGNGDSTYTHHMKDAPCRPSSTDERGRLISWSS